MALSIPTNAQSLENRSKTDIQRNAPGSKPHLKNSLVGAIATANANRVYDFYGQLDLLQFLLMPDTATDEFLERWAAIYGLQRLAATKATGTIIANGTVSSNINIGTV
ncbi:MAG: baseplate J/gp47 family protein, partial [Gammaproteobacteria bacterium]|nr:baseplate J/gp47 family protein [Gammaproteobacteria bacterium]